MESVFGTRWSATYAVMVSKEVRGDDSQGGPAQIEQGEVIRTELLLSDDVALL
jgi:hypothetical protein